MTNAAGGTILVSSGVLEFKAAVSGGGKATIGGGTLKMDAAFSEAVAFTGATGTLDLAQSQAFHGKISGFSTTGATALDLRDITFTSGITKATYAGTTASGILTVTDGTHTAKIALVGDYTHSTWKLSAATGGGTKVVDPQSSAGAAAFAQTLAGFAAVGGVAGGSTSSLTPAPSPLVLARPG